MTIGKRVTGQRLGIMGYLFALREIQKSPLSNYELASVMSLCRKNAGLLARRLRSVGLIHIGGWADGSIPQSAKVPIYHYGPGEDMPYPTGRVIASKATNSINSSAIAASVFLKILEHPISKADIAELTGFNHRQSLRVVNYAHEIGLVRIADWMPSFGPGVPTAMYALGDKPDASRPKKMGRQRRQKIQRVRSVFELRAS